MPARLTRSLTTHVRDDLAAQRVARQPVAEPLDDPAAGSSGAARRRTTARRAGSESSTVVGQRDLGVGRRAPRARSTSAPARPTPAASMTCLAPGGTPARGRARRALQRPDEPLVHREHRGRLEPRVAEQDVLLVVVARAPARRPRRSSRRAARCALGAGSAPSRTAWSSRILMLTSWSEVSTPGGVVDGVGVDAATRPARRRGVLDAAELGEPRLPPSPTTLRAQLRPVDPDRVVGLVADVGVRLGAGLDVGADAAVPEQVDRRRRASPCISSAGDSDRPSSAQAEPGSRTCARDRDGLRRARVDAAAWQRAARGRSRPTTSAAGRTAGGARRTTRAASGSGSRKMCRWSNAATSRMCSESSMPLPNTSPDMSPTPTTVKSSALGVDAQLAEVPLDRLPRAAGGDAHRLVVVADRAARGERVAEPEAVVERRPRWRCRRTSRCPCRPRRRGRCRRRRGGPRRRRHDLAAVDGDQVVGDVEQPADERAVARDALGQQRLAVRAAVGRRPLDDEAALGADRHDDGVLHHLRLHQAEHLGAEVLAAVGPAQPAARDRRRSAGARPRPAGCRPRSRTSAAAAAGRELACGSSLNATYGLGSPSASGWK